MIKTDFKKGFTLLEVMLYVFIFSLLGVAMFQFSNISVRANAYSQSVAELESQGSAVMLKIITAINNAPASNGINYPGLGQSATSLSLVSTATATNPIIFAMGTSSLIIKQGSGPALDLTSNKIKVSNLKFTNFGRANTSGVIQIKFTLSIGTDNDSKESQYSRDFVSAANPLQQ